jgi:hypothetical protein
LSFHQNSQADILFLHVALQMAKGGFRDRIFAPARAARRALSCCSVSAVTQQVDTDAHTSKNERRGFFARRLGREPKTRTPSPAAKEVVEPSKEEQFPKGTASPVPVQPGSVTRKQDLKSEVPAELPGSIASPRGKDIPAVKEGVATPVAVEADTQKQHVSQTPSTPVKDLPQESASESLSKQLQSTALASSPSSKLPEITDQLPLKPSSAQLRLLPVQATVTSIKGIFEQYLARVPQSLGQTFDCSWEKLELETKKAKEGSGDPLEWCWLSSQDGLETGNASEGHDSVLGLVVFRLMRTSSVSHCIICHFSLAEEAWCNLIPGSLEALRAHIFQHLPASSIRVSLWYSNQEDGSYGINKDAEGKFKDAGYRWFQLTNTSDGKRGQIMALRRNDELDPPAPQETPDLAFASCLVVPNKGNDPPWLQEATPSSSSRGPRPPSNMIVLAECLRRHSLQAEKCDEELSDFPEATSPKVLLKFLLNRLSKRPEGKKVGAAIVRSSLTGNVEQFVAECLKEAAVGSEMREACSEWVSSVTPSEANNLLSAGIALSLNFKDHRPDALNSSWSSIGIQAVGGKAEEFRDNPVAYIGTEDDEVFIMVWKLPTEMTELSSTAVYDLSRRLLREAPPSEDIESGVIRRVVMPRSHLCLPAAKESTDAVMEAATDVERSPEVESTTGQHKLPQAPSLDFDQSRELLALKVSPRPVGAGVLRPADSDGPEAALRLDSAFLFSVWHATYDDLEVPIFTAIVHPEQPKELS